MNAAYSFTVAGSGIRLDKFVAEQIPELSRTHARKLIDESLVTVNGTAARPSLRLEPGDVIEITVPPETAPGLPAEDIPLSIVYEDDDVLVVDKPAGLTVHPAPGHPEHTLVNALLGHLPELSSSDDPVRPGIVHRLDKDTSGLIVIAKNRRAHAALTTQFSARTVSKTYLVLVKGRLSPQKGIIESNIGRDTLNRQRMAVVSEGRPARTLYTVKRYLDDFTLAEIKLETGRTHQIRVHLAAIGFPVAGDPTYGVKVPFLSRQFLHAHRIGFRHPVTGKEMDFESPLPPDLQQAIDAIA
jgi:23S rRNA pseudouridine1911/1915/1917 synthase